MWRRPMLRPCIACKHFNRKQLEVLFPPFYEDFLYIIFVLLLTGSAQRIKILTVFQRFCSTMSHPRPREPGRESINGPALRQSGVLTS
jgi:hypothetical protein